MPTRRRRRPARRALVVGALALGVLAAAHPSVGARPSGAGAPGLAHTLRSGTGDELSLTFDWPLDCAVAVTQETFAELPDGGSVLIGATYDVELVDTAAPDDVELRFGRPEISDVLVDDEDAPPPSEGSAQHDLLAGYLSNPTLAVALDGTVALDIGFDSWLEESGVSPAQFGRDEGGLRDLVDYRSTWITWATWVGRWADLGHVAPGSADLHVSNEREFGAGTESPLAVEVERSSGGMLTLRAISELDDSAVEQLWEYAGAIDPATEVNATEGDASRQTVMEVVTDPDTLRPLSASYRATLSIDGRVAGALTHSWTFAWPDCDGAVSVGDLEVSEPAAPTTTEVPQPDVFVPPGFDTVALDELPPEALDTIALIERGGPFPYERDGSVFGNFEGILPARARGYYREYTVETPGSDDRGARRIVTGDGGEVFYTDDHYESFRVVVP